MDILIPTLPNYNSSSISLIAQNTDYVKYFYKDLSYILQFLTSSKAAESHFKYDLRLRIAKYAKQTASTPKTVYERYVNGCDVTLIFLYYYHNKVL